MKKIDLKKTCKKQTVTIRECEQIKNLISASWDKESKIVIDFNNISIASVSFLDEAFGKLAFDHPKEILRKKLSFANIEEYDRALLNDILISRYHQKELGKNGLSK